MLRKVHGDCSGDFQWTLQQHLLSYCGDKVIFLYFFVIETFQSFNLLTKKENIIFKVDAVAKLMKKGNTVQVDDIDMKIAVGQIK